MGSELNTDQLKAFGALKYWEEAHMLHARIRQQIKIWNHGLLNYMAKCGQEIVINYRSAHITCMEMKLNE